MRHRRKHRAIYVPRLWWRCKELIWVVCCDMWFANNIHLSQQTTYPSWLLQKLSFSMTTEIPIWKTRRLRNLCRRRRVRQRLHQPSWPWPCPSSRALEERWISVVFFFHCKHLASFSHRQWYYIILIHINTYLYIIYMNIFISYSNIYIDGFELRNIPMLPMVQGPAAKSWWSRFSWGRCRRIWFLRTQRAVAAVFGAENSEIRKWQQDFRKHNHDIPW